MKQLARCLYASMICVTGLAASADTLRAADPSCYLRLYDGQHLARHPNQKVTRIMLAVDPDNLGGQKPRFGSMLRLNVQGVTEIFSGAAYCSGERGQLVCRIEGDGGTFSIKPGSNDSLTIDVVGDGLRFEGNSGFAEVGGRVSDDNRFILSRVEFERCGVKTRR